MTRYPQPSSVFATALLLSLTIVLTAAAQSPAPHPAAHATNASPSNLAEPSASEKREATARARETSAQKQWVKIVLTSSRPEVTRNNDWGLTADITNTSAAPILIRPSELELIVEPEVSAAEKCWSLKPLKSASVPNDQIILQPLTHFEFFWKPEETCLRNGWNPFSKASLGFIPGPYVFTVEGKLHLLTAAGDVYHPFAEFIPVKLGLEQTTMLVCAGFGALLAYLVTAFRDKGDLDRLLSATCATDRIKAAGALLRNALSATFLGAVLSVIASRISDTQFPIKVSVSDVWGALTVGFVFYFVGYKLIDKLVGSLPVPAAARNNPTQNPTAPSASTTPTNPSPSPA